MCGDGTGHGEKIKKLNIKPRNEKRNNTLVQQPMAAVPKNITAGKFLNFNLNKNTPIRKARPILYS